ncbi:MAG: radical SAM protein [Deltaproteobacteria bacterium]
MSTAAADRLSEQASAARVPMYGSLELTWRCNFRCVHCYQEGLRARHRELSAAEWRALLRELSSMGCLFLTLTGGEPLLRPDFAEIYSQAVELGFIVTIFTNASLVTDELLALWDRLPPKKLEVTLYGASDERYAEVAGCGLAFGPVMAAVDALLARGHRVDLKAQAMRPLLADLPELHELARARGIALRVDGHLFPRLDGDRAPLAHRLSAEELVTLQQGQPYFDEQLAACFGGAPPELGDRVYRCGAGANAFNVNPSGHVEPCVISRGVSVDVREVGAAAAWEALRVEAERVNGGEGESCGSCGARGGCSRCPGLSWMETGHVERPVAHHCEVTATKLKILGKEPPPGLFAARRVA